MLKIVHLSNHNPQPKIKKVDHRTKAYMDNLKREFLLEHNAKFSKK